MKAIDISGQTFGRWTVLSRVENTNKGQAQFLCRCECGAERVMQSILLRRAVSRSCGCLKNEVTLQRSTKHGHANAGKISPTYWSWAGMIARCTNPKHRNFSTYGGRGIKVHKSWLTFTGFLADMGEKPAGTSLDRIDNNKSYTPKNCRWATPKTQARNKRSSHNLTFQDETHTIAEWAERLNLSQGAIHDRLSYGWDVEKTLSTPAGTVNNNARSRIITFNGETHTLSEWSRQTGISTATLCRRLQRGWNIGRTLSSPPNPKYRHLN